MVSAGNAIRISIDVTNIDHMNIGMRMYVMPGARIATIVVRKFSPEDCGCARYQQPDHPPVDGEARCEIPLGEIRVAEPSRIRQPAANPTEMQQDSRDQGQPEAERVEPRERDVARADLQRD